MLTKKNIYQALFIILIAFASTAEACRHNNRYWVASDDGSDKFWHNSANWSCTSGGSGGASVPNDQKK